MSFRLRPSAFDAARALAGRIRERGWIWQGRQELDGLCCPKAWFEGEGWIGALTPWLPHALGVRETGSLVILDFEKPLDCDCAALGRVLPLRRIHGALASFDFVLSGAQSGALAGQLVIIDGAERSITPLDAFRPVDVAQWWCFAALDAEEGVALPTKPLPPGEGISSSATSFDPDGFSAGLEDLRSRIGPARTSPLEHAGEVAAHILAGLARLIAWLAIAGLLVSIFSAWKSGGGIADWLPIFGYVFAAYLWFSFRADRTVGPADGAGTAGEGAAGAARPAGIPDLRFGFLRRAAGWLFWNTALGSGARDKYGKRLREIEALFARGALDEALRKGLALGGPAGKDEPRQPGWFGDFPLGGPGMRRDLNIRYHLARVPAFGILTGAGLEHLRELYRKQAEALTESGDYERAAFIYAELLNDAAAAVRVFERKGDFATAARLAQGRRLAPSVFIPLWFKAGEKSRALRLAAQYDAFADLIAQVKVDDPFHQEVVKAWCARLVATGDIARALELSERYGEAMPERRDWLLQGLEREPLDVVLLARGLKSLGADHGPRLQQLFERCLAANGPDHAGARSVLAAAMADPDFELAATDPVFRAGRLPLQALPLLRALLKDEADYGSDKERRDIAVALSEASGQLALRVDLRRLNRVHVTAGPASPRHIVMGDAGELARVRDVVCLAKNRLLIAYANAAVHLTGRDGRRLWSDHVHNVRGLVPIGGGAMILVVRDEIEGAALSLLDLDARTHKDIGFFNVEAFAGTATEIGWMVSGGKQVCLLDTASLIEAAKKGGGALRHHWAVPMTEPGRICAFRDHAAAATFLYQRDLAGLMELWTVSKTTLQVECSFIAKTQDMPRADVQTYGWQGGTQFFAHAGDCSQIKVLALPVVTYSLAAERRLAGERAWWLEADQSIAPPNRAPTTVVWCTAKPAAKPASVPATAPENAARGVTWLAAYSSALHDPLTVEFPDASRVSARLRANSPIATVFDDLGRIIAVNLDRSEVLFRNDRR